MKNIIVYLSAIYIAFLGFGCGKADNISPHAQLIAATYTATKVEMSQTNNGTGWVDITRIGVREVLTIEDKKSFTTAWQTVSTGIIADPISGTWTLSADGNTISFLTFFGTQDYTITALTATDMVVTLKGPNKLTPLDSAIYPYYRITYTRS